MTKPFGEVIILRLRNFQGRCSCPIKLCGDTAAPKRGFFMKNIGKLFGIITLVAVIGFSMTACDDGNSGGGRAA
jgi:hypothetical protein